MNQVKFLYNDFTPGEVHKLKLMIQRDIYKYIIILLEARERFEDEENIKRSAGEISIYSSFFHFSSSKMRYWKYNIQTVFS
jgi:hypothetical protein